METLIVALLTTLFGGAGGGLLGAIWRNRHQAKLDQVKLEQSAQLNEANIHRLEADTRALVEKARSEVVTQLMDNMRAADQRVDQLNAQVMSLSERLALMTGRVVTLEAYITSNGLTIPPWSSLPPQ